MIPCIEINEDSHWIPCKRDAYLETLKALLQLIPLNKVTTYKHLSKLLKTSPRAIGALLKRNDQPIVVPCHRVVRSDRIVGGYTWKGSQNPDFKKRLLILEGVQINKDKVSANFLCSPYERLTR